MTAHAFEVCVWAFGHMMPLLFLFCCLLIVCVGQTQCTYRQRNQRQRNHGNAVFVCLSYCRLGPVSWNWKDMHVHGAHTCLRVLLSSSRRARPELAGGMGRKEERTGAGGFVRHWDPRTAPPAGFGKDKIIHPSSPVTPARRRRRAGGLVFLAGLA